MHHSNGAVPDINTSGLTILYPLEVSVAYNCAFKSPKSRSGNLLTCPAA